MRATQGIVVFDGLLRTFCMTLDYLLTHHHKSDVESQEKVQCVLLTGIMGFQPFYKQGRYAENKPLFIFFCFLPWIRITLQR